MNDFPDKEMWDEVWAEQMGGPWSDDLASSGQVWNDTLAKLADGRVWDYMLAKLAEERPDAHGALERAALFQPQRGTASETAKDMLDALQAAGWEVVRGE